MMRLNTKKILNIFKSASHSLYSVWSKTHPLRYSDSESGMNSWIDDLKAFGIMNEDDLARILNDDFDTSFLEKMNDWSDISSMFPSGDKIRKVWQANSSDKSLSAFIFWLKKGQSANSRGILDQITKKNPTENNKTNSSVVFPNSDSDIEFYKAILNGINAPITNNNIYYLYAWRQAEGGKASFNPFNTTQKAEGATNYNSVGVKNYISEQQGISATIKTISNGRYDQIISCLRSDADPKDTAKALIDSPWGTGELIMKVISGYQSGASPKPPPIKRS